MVPVHPGRILRRELHARNLSANALARALRVPSGRIVDILNGKPGLTKLTVTVNGKVFKVKDLEDGEKWSLDVSSAMKSGNSNTISLEASGKPGGSADVVVHD